MVVQYLFFILKYFRNILQNEKKYSTTTINIFLTILKLRSYKHEFENINEKDDFFYCY